MQFKNIFDFFNYIEFCPLCKNRLQISASSISIAGCELDNKYIQLYSYEFPKSSYSIHLLTNDIRSLSLITDNLTIWKQCSKYHFYISSIITISNSNITSIFLNKYNIIRILKDIHFTINGSYIQNSSHIRLVKDYKTTELNTNLINFNSFSKKEIDNKLKKMILLF
jgi:hypothetical protein